MNPFFSVCIPTTNREKTIYNTLSSVASQSFRDFEVIVVDCGSTDNTRAEIDRFFKSDCFAKNPFYYKYETRDYYPQTVEDWNEPLKLAGGKYIAMLEGDDQYLPNHLSEAYSFLNSHEGIGLYAVGNQIQKRSSVGHFSCKEWFLMTISYEDITPPSESIFRRIDSDGKPFLYNVIDYEYAPEADLYIKIALKKFDVYFSEKCNVVRNISNKNRYTNIWHYYVDRFTLLFKYKELINPDLFNKSLNAQIDNTIKLSIDSRSFKNILSIANRIIKRTSLVFYTLSFIRVTIRIVLNKFCRLFYV